MKNNYLFFGLLALLMCVLGSGSSLIYILDEAKNSEAAREMLLYGNWFKPTFNNIIRTDKPPLHYFFMMLGYKVFGVNALGARFFSGVFGALTILNTYHFAKKHINVQVANTCFILMLSSFYFIQEFHLAVPDPYLIFFISATLFSLIDFLLLNHKKSLYLAYGFMGLGVLTKGPVAIVMPFLIVLIYVLAKKQFNIKTVVKFKIHIGLLIILTIAFPWFYMAHIKTNGLFTEGFFLKHNIGRFQSKMEGHGGVFLITWGFVLLGMLPFSFWLFRASYYGMKTKTKEPFIYFSTLSVLVFVVFFSIAATKLPNYTMPCYPFIAILLAWFFVEIYHKKINLKYSWIEWFFLLLITIMFPIVGYLALQNDAYLSSIKHLGLGLLFLPVGVMIGFRLFQKQLLVKSFIAVAISFSILGLYLFYIAFPRLTDFSPVAVVNQQISKNRSIVVFKRFDAAFPINNKITYNVVETIEELDAFFEKHPYGVVMTKTRSEKDLEKLSIYKNIITQKSLFENHTTRIYQKK